MKKFVIFCKSYSKDLYRVERLLRSYEKYNQDKIDFFLSVPTEDIDLFNRHLKGRKLNLLSDEEILEKNPNFSIEIYQQIDGYIGQQIVKSEFWRTKIAENFLCIDSDAEFIRDFYLRDFMYDIETPYTVYDEAHDLFLNSMAAGKTHIYEQYKKQSTQVAAYFERKGKIFSYGPMPIWSAKVWETLDENVLKKNQIDIFKFIQKYPHEVMIYGETLLKYRPIPIVSCQPLFRTYHYSWQLDYEIKNNINVDLLRKIFIGTVRQSNWEREIDWPFDKSTFLSRLNRKIKRVINRI